MLKSFVMRIAIFTDTYRPSVNGIVYVTEILRHQFEQLGHEVYVFAPGDSLRVSEDDPHLIQFPAVKGLFFDEFNTSLFFPLSVLRKIEDMNFDVIHFLTPGQVGLMAIYAANKLDIPLVGEYCTDLFEHIEHYPAVLPGLIALSAVLPFTMGARREDFKEVLSAGRPRLGVKKWNQQIVRHLVTLIHQRCSAVIVHSRKSHEQLSGWWDGKKDSYPMYVIPTGIDEFPKASASEIAKFKKAWHIQPTDEVLVSIGRLSAEKNLDMLIPTMEKLLPSRPNAKLVFVGDFDYRPKLEAKARASTAADRIIFVGKIPREKLGVAHGVAKLLVFPSLTDTQSLVLNEATRSGLPVVMIDYKVTEVVVDGENGFFAKNDPKDMAKKIAMILEDPKLQKKMSANSKKLASKFSEKAQAKKIIDLYKQILDTNARKL